MICQDKYSCYSQWSVYLPLVISLLAVMVFIPASLVICICYKVNSDVRQLVIKLNDYVYPLLNKKNNTGESFRTISEQCHDKTVEILVVLSKSDSSTRQLSNKLAGDFEDFAIGGDWNRHSEVALDYIHRNLCNLLELARSVVRRGTSTENINREIKSSRNLLASYKRNTGGSPQNEDNQGNTSDDLHQDQDTDNNTENNRQDTTNIDRHSKQKNTLKNSMKYFQYIAS